MIACIWECIAKKEKIGECEEYDSSAGARAKLFAKGAGFRGTLLHDIVRAAVR